MPETGVTAVQLLAIAFGIRANRVWFFRERSSLRRWRPTAGSLATSLVIVNCMYFSLLWCEGDIVGFGTHYLAMRMVGWYVLGSIAATSCSLLLNGESR